MTSSDDNQQTTPQTPGINNSAERNPETSELESPLQSGDLKLIGSASPIPGYRLKPEIARGGMGIVYAAECLTFGREVAIKVMKSGMSEAAFNREARITARLPHPGIPPVHALGTLPSGLPYLVMKLIRGETLESILKKRSDISTDRGRLITAFEGICQAVGYAHSKGIIHRDLKPANVMVGTFGEVQVMDWGLAKEINATDEATEVSRTDEAGLTVAGQVKGTPTYMAPEQARGMEVDARADVFALGGILTAILTGHAPFGGTSVLETVTRAAKCDLGKTLERLRSSTADPDLLKICIQCLSANPKDRPDNGIELGSTIAQYRAEVEQRLIQSERERAASEAKATEEKNTRREAEAKAAENQKRRRVQWALVGTVLLLLIASIIGAALASLWRGAEGLRVEADRERKKSREYLYFSRIGLASKAWQDFQIYRMNELINSELTQPDGSHIRGFEWDYLLRLRNVKQNILTGHTDFVESVNWSPNGKYIASGSYDNTVLIYDSNSFYEKIAVEKYDNIVFDIAFNNASSLLASSNVDQSLSIWSIVEKKNILKIQGHTARVRKISWSPDDKKIATASWDGTARIWNAITGEQETVYKGHTSLVECIAYNPSGEIVASCGQDRIIHIWSPESGAVVKKIPSGHTSRIMCVCWSPDGALLATGSDDHSIRIWDISNERILHILTGHQLPVFSLRISEDNKTLFSASKDGTIRCWDCKQGYLKRLYRGHTGAVTGISLSPDGNRAATSSNDKTVRIWNILQDQDSMVLNGKDWMIDTAFHPEGSVIASLSRNGEIYLWNSQSGDSIREIKAHKNFGYALAFTPDGKYLASGSADGQIKIWDWKDLSKPALEGLAGLNGPAYRMSFSPDSRHLVTATGSLWYIPSKENSSGIAIWDLKNMKRIADFNNIHLKGVTAIAYTPDGKYIGSSSKDGTFKIWDPTSGKVIFTKNWTESWPECFSFHPNGKEVAIGIVDGSIQTFEINSGKQILNFRGHTDHLLRITYDKQGKRLATASHDGTVKVWHPGLGLELLSLNSHKAPVMGLAFSKDGYKIASSSQDTTVRVWDGSPATFENPFDEVKAKENQEGPAIGLQKQIKEQNKSPGTIKMPFDEVKAKEKQKETAKSLQKEVEEQEDLGKGIKLEMVLIPPGNFIMGTPASQAGGTKIYEVQHEVTLTNPYYMGKYEVTQEQWELIQGSNPSMGTKGPKFPVTDVSWEDCQKFIENLNSMTKENYRLPTEAEWEYACRAGTITVNSFGKNEMTSRDANTFLSRIGKPVKVGMYKPNAFGLYDMHGNVWEWCEDWYDVYPTSPVIDPKGPATGTLRVLRGGSFDGIYGSALGSSSRGRGPVDGRVNRHGFRLVKTIISKGAPTITKTEPAKLKEEERIKLAALEKDMVLIPGGKFKMGSSSDENERFSNNKQHEVTLTKPYYLGKYEITQEQWEAVTGKNSSYIRGKKLPVTNISWDDCQEFINKLNAKTEGGYRLPTEAEWEFACRAGKSTTYSVGEKITINDANYDNPKGGTKLVGSYKPNAFGLYDMHGNVIEWCNDWYGEYLASTVTDPKGSNTGHSRVLRGGSYFQDDTKIHSSYRYYNIPSLKFANYGFRVAKSVNLETKTTNSEPSGVLSKSLNILEFPFTETKAKENQKIAASYFKKELEERVNLENGVSLDLVFIPFGKFKMGSSEAENEKFSTNKQHEVTLNEPFLIGKYEVTQENWEMLMGNNPSYVKGSKLPVTNVSWYDCQEFIKRLNAKTEGGYRLPTEAEWEFACRAGKSTTYSFGDKITIADANYDNPKGGIKVVGSFKPNDFGLHDMHGNVWEWCEDWYGNYSTGSVTGPKELATGSNRVLRGGSYFNFDSVIRSSSRGFNSPNARLNYNGFRLARTFNNNNMPKNKSSQSKLSNEPKSSK